MPFRGWSPAGLQSGTQASSVDRLRGRAYTYPVCAALGARLLDAKRRAGILLPPTASGSLRKLQVMTWPRRFIWTSPAIRGTTFTGLGVGKWILDLTKTALFTLLASWGEEHEQLTALCDHADPLKQDQSLFDAMINRKVRVCSDAFGERLPLQLSSYTTPGDVIEGFEVACGRWTKEGKHEEKLQQPER